MRWGETDWESGERRAYLLTPGDAMHQLYKLHVTAVGDNDRAVMAVAELELHRATQGGELDDSNFVCSGGAERWSASDPNALPVVSNSTEDDDELAARGVVIDFSVSHVYSLDLRSDGVIDFLFDNTVVRSWEDDSFKYGTVGFGNQCRESTIESFTIHQTCEVKVLIHVEGKGYDTRWNIDRLDEMTFVSTRSSSSSGSGSGSGSAGSGSGSDPSIHPFHRNLAPLSLLSPLSSLCVSCCV